MKKIKPLSLLEWEMIHIQAEECFFNDDMGKEMILLSKNIFKLSLEIRRLRLKCGEKVWQSCRTTDKEKKDYVEMKALSSSKGGINKRPISDPPSPPKGQGGKNVKF